MKIEPSRDIILIEVDPPKTKTASGLYIKEDWKTLPLTGTVAAVGSEVYDLKKGDRIMFERYASVILEDNQRLCKASHVLARLHGKAK